TPSQGQTRRRARCRVRATLRFTGAAKVAELADAPDLGSGSRKALGVRVPPFAPAFAPDVYASMKTEFVDVNETRKNLRVEIPTDIVNAEIDRIARDYSRKARIPGFRPGKAPARVIKHRYRDQILHDVAQDLVPRAIDDALR